MSSLVVTCDQSHHVRQITSQIKSRPLCLLLPIFITLTFTHSTIFNGCWPPDFLQLLHDNTKLYSRFTSKKLHPVIKYELLNMHFRLTIFKVCIGGNRCTLLRHVLIECQHCHHFSLYLCKFVMDCCRRFM